MSLFDVFFSFAGRIRRSTFFLAIVFVWCAFFNLNYLLESWFGASAGWWLCLPLLWSIIAVSVKRYHDIGKTGRNLLLLFIPVIGPLWVFVELCCRKGVAGTNRYGESPRAETIGYLKVTTPSFTSASEVIVNDITQLNPITVKKVFTPQTIEELCEMLKTNHQPISVGGGHFSMGGQTASPASVHIDMRSLNKIINFNALAKTIRVQAGTRWCDIQRCIDPQNLSVKIMQTYANFTVGGALSVNAHGRYIGLGPLILSVRAIKIALVDGSLVEATPTQNTHLFYGAIGCYAALSIIVEAELDLADNVKVEQIETNLEREAYRNFFVTKVRNNPKAIFHNADIYPPHYQKLRAISWLETEAEVSNPYRLMPLQKSYPIHRYFYWAFSETIAGKWRREFIYDPLIYQKKRVHWRNYEAGYDVAELEPSSRQKNTFVLQEYFVSVDQFDAFVPKMASILQRYDVNVINVSVRHALADSGSYLAWAKTEVFAFVIYYKQGVSEKDKETVGNWTRELIDAALSCEGTYYLPYQSHATLEQFHKAYPRAKELFVLKQQFDPGFQLRNVLWDKYYQ